MEQATEKQIWKMKQLGIEVPDGCTKQRANDLISEKLGTNTVSSLPKSTSYTPKKGQDTTTFYVAYAKDIFLGLIETGAINEVVTAKDVMSEAIQLVKLARQEFTE